MIRELIEAWRTPASAIARELGYLYESIAMRERYRRCRDEWDAHLVRCHRAMELAVSSCRGGTLAVCGSGLLLEVPLETLRRRFSKIILIDLVHPRAVRRKYGACADVVLLEQDLLGIAEELAAWKPGLPLPTPRPPDLSFLNADFLISANCLSQLPIQPRHYLEANRCAFSDEELNRYCRELSNAHLAMIGSMDLPHLIIADFETRAFNRDGTLAETAKPFYRRESLTLKDEWIWKIAPQGEMSGKHDVEMSVGAFVLR